MMSDVKRHNFDERGKQILCPFDFVTALIQIFVFYRGRIDAVESPARLLSTVQLNVTKTSDNNCRNPARTHDFQSNFRSSFQSHIRFNKFQSNVRFRYFRFRHFRFNDFRFSLWQQLFRFLPILFVSLLCLFTTNFHLVLTSFCPISGSKSGSGANFRSNYFRFITSGSGANGSKLHLALTSFFRFLVDTGA